MDNRSIVSLQQLPIEVLTMIVQKVGKASSADYCNLRATCKIMKEASNNPAVLNSLCLSPLVKRPLRALQHLAILGKCDHENYTAFFVRGILCYFEEDDTDNEMAYLELAAIGEGDDLILEAAYLYGVLRFLHGNPVSHIENLALMNWRDEEEDLETPRVWKNLRKTLHGITVRKKTVYVQLMENIKPSRSCHVLDMEINCPNCFMYKRCLKFFYMKSTV